MYDIKYLEEKMKSINDNMEKINKIDNQINIDIKNNYFKYTCIINFYNDLNILYDIFNNEYLEYINSFSKPYIEMSEYYVGECIPKKKFYNYIINILIIISYIDLYTVNIYDVD